MKIIHIILTYFIVTILFSDQAHAQFSAKEIATMCGGVSSKSFSAQGGTIAYDNNGIRIVGADGDVRIENSGGVLLAKIKKYTADSYVECLVKMRSLDLESLLEKRAASDKIGGERKVFCREMTGQKCLNLTNKKTDIVRMLDANHPKNNRTVYGFFISKPCKIILKFRREDRLGFGFHFALKTESDSRLVASLLGNQRLIKTEEVGSGMYFLHLLAQNKYGNNGSGLKRISLNTVCF